MNFFSYQHQARRASTRLVLLFGLAVIGIVLAVNLAAYPFIGGDLQLQAMLSVAVLLVIGIASLVRIRALRAGGAMIAAQMGGVLVPADTTDALLRRYRNVAEEMAIAAGIPVPMLFVLEDEPGINAFAAGYSPADAAVAVTRGALQRLNRDELQGVIAHEYSHVLNGDMRLNIHLMGVLFGILMLGVIGRKLISHMHLGSFARRRDGIGPAMVILLIGLVAIIIGSIGVFFARLIKAAVSRQREVLADASAVQFTRNNLGLAGALKKIAGLEHGSQLANRAGAEEVSHMLFGEGFAWSRWFATHPPMLERIARLQPGFSSNQLKLLQRRWQQSPPDGLEEDRVLGLGEAGQSAAAVEHSDAGAVHPAPAAASSHADGRVLALEPALVSAQVANPGCDDYRQAHALHEQLPLRLRTAARSREQAPALVLALLLDRQPQRAQAQQRIVSELLGQDVLEMMTGLSAALDGLHAGLRLPLAAMAFPALRSNPRPQLQRLVQAIDALVQADGQLSLFEYCLGRLLRTQVIEALDPAAHASFGRRRVGSVQQEFATLLSVVAWAGHPDQPAQAQRAFHAGMQRVVASQPLHYAPPSQGVVALDQVWPALDALDPLAKQVVVEALTATVALDGRISVAEAELLRTVCGVLHCPLPACLQAGN